MEDKADTSQRLYEEAVVARVGKMIGCPGCGRKHMKRSYQQKFCCTKCKDRFWNSRPERIERTLQYSAPGCPQDPTDGIAEMILKKQSHGIMHND